MASAYPPDGAIEGAAKDARRVIDDKAAEGREAGASAIHDVAASARAFADSLQDANPISPATPPGRRQGEDVSEAIRSRSVGDLLRDVDGFARREPVAFFGAALVAGFALSRFLGARPTAPGAHATRIAPPDPPYGPITRRRSPASRNSPATWTAAPASAVRPRPRPAGEGPARGRGPRRCPPTSSIEEPAMNGQDQRSVFDLFTNVVDSLSLLFRKEVELAKAEMSEKAAEIGGGATRAGIGAVLVIPALVMLLWAAAMWLEAAGVPLRWGVLIVGVVVALVGGLMLRSGLATATGANLAPRRTTHQLQSDARLVKEQVQ